MRKAILAAVAFFLACGLSEAQVRIATAYNYPLLPGSAQDSVLNGLKSIRGCYYGTNVEGDGKNAIAVTNYNDNGRVSVFQVVGNDSIRLVWTSPHLTAGGGSTPRVVLFGDLDNDGKKEVIFQSNSNGIYIFEHDGVPGSHNFGTAPSQLIGSADLANVTGNAEYMEIGDVDGDNQNELLVAYNASTNATDKYYIISAIGDWSTGDPGFSAFSVEYAGTRTDLTAWGIAGGSPYAMIAAQFDGTGNKEILIHNWNLKNIVPMRVPSANTYLLSDTTTGKQNYFAGGPNDYVALFGGFATDIDGDGREEVYLPTYTGSLGGPGLGRVDMISYNAGQLTSRIDSTNVTNLDASSTGIGTSFGYGYGDLDGNGKKNIYVSSTYPTNVVSLEFQGGDKRNPANWIASVVYPGDPSILTQIVYRDSSGVRDTLKTIDASFVSKMYSANTDFDGDGKKDIIMPYQALSDSMTILRLTWNGIKFDTVTTKQANPKRWGLRVLESTGSAGVEAKEMTIITPDDYRLEQNYPNPFNPSTTIAFYLPVRDRISLKVHDVLGREVRTLFSNQEYDRGTSRVVWDGRDNNGKVVGTGTYFYTLKFGNFEKTNKMILMK